MKNIIPVLIFCIIFPTCSFANPPVEPKITGLVKGESAPYSGVLLNSLAAARLFTERDFSEEECKLKIDFAVQKEFTRMNLLLESLKVTNDSLEQKYGTIIKIKDNEIKRLTDLAIKPKNNYSVWWASGGVIIGITLTIVTVYAVGELR